jgi:AcrR family transcriptional regulator
VDARQRKTRAKLAAVILRLAAERPASELTVSEITVAAEINRSTFYQHAASPMDLLERVLREELDSIRNRFLPVSPAPTALAGPASASSVSAGTAPTGPAPTSTSLSPVPTRATAMPAVATDVVSPVSPTAIRDVTAAVIEHVGSHSALYSRALGATSGASSLHPLLSRHFAESVTQLLSQHGVTIPRGDSPDAATDPYVVESAARFIADGTVGAIEVWLRTPEPRSVASFLAVYTLIMPTWWPLDPQQ